jgi:hypothetical protein
VSRPKTHKFALQTKGLTNEEALQLAYVIYSAGHAFAKEASSFATNVLRKAYPDHEWHTASASYRKSLV